MIRLLRSSAAVFLGNSISAAMGFGILVLLTRGLEPASFGTLAAMLNIIDLGLAIIDSLLLAGVVITVSRYATSDPPRASMALKIGLVLRLSIVALIIASAALFADDLSMLLLGTDTWSGEIKIVLLTLCLLTLYGFLTGVLQARQQFGLLGIATTYKNLFRLALIGGLFVASELSVSSVAMALLIGAGAALALVLVSAPIDFMRIPGWDRSVFSEIFAINKWMALAALGLLGARIDILMLVHWSTPEEVGFYSAALQLCLIVTMISTAFVTTLLPRTAQIVDPGQMLKQFVRCLPFIPVGVGVLVVSFWLSPLLLELALGTDYLPATNAFNLLLASAILTLVTNPVLMLFFPLKMVPAYAAFTLAQLGLRVVANTIFVPMYGSTGAAAIDLAVKVATVPIAMAFIYVAIKRQLDGATPSHELMQDTKV